MVKDWQEDLEWAPNLSTVKYDKHWSNQQVNLDSLGSETVYYDYNQSQTNMQEKSCLACLGYWVELTLKQFIACQPYHDDYFDYLVSYVREIEHLR